MHTNRKSTLALIALAISAFAIGTTEFISVGLLPLIADDLHITVRTAGLTVTIYALGVTVGAPILTSLTGAVPRKTLLLWIMAVFIAGNSIAAMAHGITLLLTARVISAFAHGVFMSIGSTIAASLVSENRRASAISIMFSGLTIATVTGVPLGTLLGQQWGWRSSFIAIALIGLVALAANALLVSRELNSGTRTRMSDHTKLLSNSRLLLAFTITALGYGGTFVVFTYLSPLLHEVTGFGAKTIAAILFVYGIAIAIGNLIGGRAANRRPLKALLYMFAAQAVVLLLLAFAAPFKGPALLVIFLMGLLAFMNVPGLQTYVVILSERFAPKMTDVASALNIAAFNAGIAIGAYVGGIVAEQVGLVHTAWVGALMVAAAAVLTKWSSVMEKRDQMAETEKDRQQMTA
ncbi:MFS transporter [Paenibacillus sp. OV219]|uniref:MFS transporter n=1 Tax=Paenibacillus sp. OV219 TaxID=1884377 RepID=UPI0008D29812|nr:Predicted arabinose efflux permease, MFS family [Paenibacillus sp. OV219]